MTISLEVTKRAKGSPASADVVPGVVYGPKQESTPLAIDRRSFEKTLEEAGESTIITLTGLEEEIEVLLHDVAFNPEKGGVEHVDFYAIERGKELTTNVPLEFVGTAPAEKGDASISKVLYDVSVTCRPSVLPSHIDVDLTMLVDEESQIRVSDLVVPEGVAIENDPEEIVASVSAAREEEPEEVPEAVDMEAVAVEGDEAEGDEGSEDAEEKKEG